MFKDRFLLVIAFLSLMTVTVAISGPFSNAPASIQPTSSSIGSPSFYEYRRGEWSPSAVVASSIGGAAFYAFRQGEIAERAKLVDARYLFRLDEIAQMAKPIDARYLFRLDEIAQMARPVDARYEYRRGEWFGK